MDQKQLDTAKMVGGMALVMLGRKTEGLSLFAKGVYDLEKIYREKHPDLEPGLENRWQKAVEFYEETHKDDTNRNLHRWGIPLIVGGAVGLLAAKPYNKTWQVSASAFAIGWAMNIVGHSKYEKRRPAFTDDPLSFIAGPVWDVQQLIGNNKKEIENERT